jgi:hypothetical protein
MILSPLRLPVSPSGLVVGGSANASAADHGLPIDLTP